MSQPGPIRRPIHVPCPRCAVAPGTVLNGDDYHIDVLAGDPALAQMAMCFLNVAHVRELRERTHARPKEASS